MLRLSQKAVFAVCLEIALLMVASLSQPAFAAGHAAAEKCLYERLGGLMPISVVVSDFIDAMIPDPFLNRNPAIDAARKAVPAKEQQELLKIVGSTKSDIVTK